MTSDVYIVDALRTPIGRHRGVLKDVRPDDLAGFVLKALLSRNGVPSEKVDEVYIGCANQAGEDNRNVARMAVLLAGMPYSVPAATVNRLCGSGMEAVVQGSRMIRQGDAEVVIAGGVEGMTRAPWAMLKPSEGFASGKWEMHDTALGFRFPNPKLAERIPLEQMGETAENVAEQFKISREEQDAFALSSHQKSIAAVKNGRFKNELVAVEVPQKKGTSLWVSEDEGPREDTTLEKLSTLKPAFRKGGTVTAGNSSSLNDGASALLLASEKAVKEYGLSPLARIVGSGTAGVDPRVMGMGPVPATQKALRLSGWKSTDVDVVELNEAFAAQAVACLRELKFEPSRVNVNGGAIALGHPLGMSGARILTTLVHEMKRQKTRKGLATMCVGLGQGIAVTVENVGDIR